MNVCTIIARNYLPAARVLAGSFLEHHPDGHVSVLVIDDIYHEVQAESEPFEIIRPRQLSLPADDFARMAAIYEVTELSTAVKPWLLHHLLERDASEPAVYLDPDIRIFGALDEVRELARSHGIVLTPHVTAPMPRDGKSFDESAVLAAGIYNLGFIAVDQRARPFLDFWMERLRRDCLIDLPNHRFVDQRWADFVPGMFDCFILRDTSYNVAYWNLFQRDLRWTEQGYTADGARLKFFHFSGFDVDAPALLSRHQGPEPRVLLSERPAVEQICSEYATALRAVTRAGEDSIGYAFSELPNGLILDRPLRRLYRERLLEAEAASHPLPPDAFSPEGADDFVRWLNSPSRGGHRVSRYLAAVHAARKDLQAAFPDPEGADHEAYGWWAWHEAAAGRVQKLLVPRRGNRNRASVTTTNWAAPGDLRPGVCVAGYLRAELGMGELGRLVLATAQEAGIETGSLAFSDTLSRQQHPFHELAAADLNVNIVVVNADQIASFASQVGRRFFDGRYTIGVWAWELEEFPAEWRSSFDYVDEVWAISEFGRRAISGMTDKPVIAFPPPVMTPRPRRAGDREELGLPEGFLFLFCFDYLSVPARKNPDGVLAAFSRAFAPGEGPRLVIKTINGAHRLAELEALKISASKRPDVMVIDGYLSSADHADLMDACDCYVSLHRSEGFGLTMAEAMALGKPVIATAYSGNLDFMNEGTAYLVPWSEGRVPAGCQPYRAGARWAEPDIEKAAELMRRVVRRPDEAAAVGARAQQSVLSDHGPRSRAALLRRRFDHAQRALGTGSPARRAAEMDAVASASLTDLARSRANVDSPSSHLWLSRPLRRVMARLTAHGDAHRADVDARLAERLLALEATVTAMGAGLDAAVSQPPLDPATAQADLLRRLAHLDTRLRRLMEGRGQATAELEQIQRRLDDLHGLARAVEAHLNGLDDELSAVPYMTDPSLLQTTAPDGRPAIGYQAARGDHPAGDYPAFEDIFRGPQAFIRDRMRPYLDLVRSRLPILDTGCGRGEFLDLLAEEGIRALGIDIDEGMAAICRAKGHTVLTIDALEYLRGLSPGSLGTAFSAQFVEHLHPDQLAEYLHLAHEALRPDGLLIAETVNPHSIRAFKTFWTDPTHHSPIFPEVAAALCRNAGFESALVVFPQGTGDLDSDRRSTGEYAIIAQKLGELDLVGHARRWSERAAARPPSGADSPPSAGGDPAEASRAGSDGAGPPRENDAVVGRSEPSDGRRQTRNGA